MDIAGLSKLSGDTIILILSVLGFMVRSPSSGVNIEDADNSRRLDTRHKSSKSPLIVWVSICLSYVFCASGNVSLSHSTPLA